MTALSNDFSPRHVRATVAAFALRGFDSLAERLPPSESAELLKQFNSAADEAIITAGGRRVTQGGAASIAIFEGAGHALNATIASIRLLLLCRNVVPMPESGTAVAPAVAIHTDAFAVLDGQTVAGSGIELARRMLAAAPPGEAVASDATMSSITHALPGGWKAVHSRGASEELPNAELTDLLPISPEYEAGNVSIQVPQDGSVAGFTFLYWAEVKIRPAAPSLPLLLVRPIAGWTPPLEAAAGEKLQRGAPFGTFELVRKVGAGGMGSVWLARDRHGNTVAIKRLLGAAGASAAMIERFRREAELTSRLVHRNIARTIEAGEIDGEVYIAMEYVDGCTLADVIAHVAGTAVAGRELSEVLRTPLPAVTATCARPSDEGSTPAAESFTEPPERQLRAPQMSQPTFSITSIATLMMRVCAAVQFAHEHGILHRDLKPANIMLRRDGEPVVLDFGLAKAVTSDSALSLSAPDAVIGSLEYMAPEQAADSGTVTARSDIFSLGAILFFLLTGRKAFEASGRPAADLLRLQSFEPPSRRSFGPLVPQDLQVIVLKALSADPAERYGTAEQLREDLERFTCGIPILARSPTLSYVASRVVQRHRRTVAVVCAVSVLVTAISVLFSIRLLKERDRAEAALERLRRSAPAYASQARHLAAEGKLAAALEQVGRAIELSPDNRDYRLMRANLLQASQRISEAIREYERVVQSDDAPPLAIENLALCRRLAGHERNGALDREAQIQLADALIAQERFAEVASLQRSLGREQPGSEAAVRSRLKGYATQTGWQDSRVTRMPNGTFRVDLSSLALQPLEHLEGLPISELLLDSTSCDALDPIASLPLVRLSLDKTNVADLKPLKSRPLKWLRISSTAVSSLEPLRGMPLQHLDAAGCRVSDLAALQNMPLQILYLTNSAAENLDPISGMKLRELTLANTRPRNLEPLAGMPLTRLDLSFASGVIDLSPLQSCNTLQSVFLPPVVANLEAIRSLPKLVEIGFLPRGKYKPAQFWNRFGAVLDPEHPACTALRAAGMKHLRLGQIEEDDDGALTLVVSQSELRELRPIAHLPIRALDISGTEVSDLEPLRETEIEVINAGGTKVADAAPLATCPRLRQATIPGTARNLEVLQARPSLRLIKGSPFARTPRGTLPTLDAPQ